MVVEGIVGGVVESVMVHWTHISFEVGEKESNERCVSASVIVNILTGSFQPSFLHVDCPSRRTSSHCQK